MVKVKTRAGWSPTTSTKPQPKKRRAETKPVSAGGAYGEFVPSEQHGSFSATGNTLHILSTTSPFSDGMIVTGGGIPAGARLVFPTETTSKAEARAASFRIGDGYAFNS